MTELKDMKKEDILNSELIGNGIPDLETEIAKLKEGSEAEQTDSGFGFGGSDEGGFFGGSQEDTDIFGFGSKKKTVEEEEED
jgi:hypothetical protein